jgi:hypothetical protein
MARSGLRNGVSHHVLLGENSGSSSSMDLTKCFNRVGYAKLGYICIRHEQIDADIYFVSGAHVTTYYPFR